MNMKWFSLYDAAYLFLDLPPLDEYRVEPSKKVRDMQRLLNYTLAHLKLDIDEVTLGHIWDCGRGREPEIVFEAASRSALKKAAEELGMRPIFLFGKKDNPPQVNNESLDSAPHPLHKKSYLLVIKGLLIIADVTTKDGRFSKMNSSIVKRLLSGVNPPISLKEDTIKKILEEVDDL